MKKDKVAFFLPTRRGSQRVKNKNTRPFANIQGGLLENKLRQLIRTNDIDEIILSTNDPECIRISTAFMDESPKLRVVERPDSLCMDSTNLQDLIAYVPSITDAEHILWGHVTTPIADEKVYDCAVNLYLEKINEGFDSLVSVIEMKNFLLNKHGKLINNSSDLPWPRTQDLESLYEINHVIFMTSRDIYEKRKNRMGERPYLYVMDKLKSFDIDWEEDFVIAETLCYAINARL